MQVTIGEVKFFTMLFILRLRHGGVNLFEILLVRIKDLPTAQDTSMTYLGPFLVLRSYS